MPNTLINVKGIKKIENYDQKGKKVKTNEFVCPHFVNRDIQLDSISIHKTDSHCWWFTQTIPMQFDLTVLCSINLIESISMKTIFYKHQSERRREENTHAYTNICRNQQKFQ